MSVALSGDFVVTWRGYSSFGNDNDVTSIQAQRYSSDGSAVGSQFQVNTYTSNSQWGSEVGLASDGSFVVVWTSAGSFGTDPERSIEGQRFAANGVPVGSQFQVNTYTPGHQQGGALAVVPDGSFVVVWQSDGSPGSDTSQASIQGRRYSSAGSPLGDQFQVNTYTTTKQWGPAVAAGPDGSFVVAWNSKESDGPDNVDSVQAQRFDSDGLPVGEQFEVNTYTSGLQQWPRVAIDGNRGFLVVWDSTGSLGSDQEGDSVQAQFFGPDGTRMGGEFQVNTYTSGTQFFPGVAVAPTGDFVVVWQSSGSSGSDTSYSSIQGQRVTYGVFADGFESGDTSAWSTVVP